jgi:hypothetical protein
MFSDSAFDPFDEMYQDDEPLSPLDAEYEASEYADEDEDEDGEN